MYVACLILDDAVFARCLAIFADHGLTAQRFTSECTLFRALRVHPIDVVLVDVGHDPAFEARVFACIQRLEVGRVPVVLQTMDRLAQHNALALQAGFADVVPRDTEPVELAARLTAAARRGHGEESAATLSQAGFVLDRATRSITHRATPVDLTPREFALAWVLFSNAGRCVSRQLISLSVWGVHAEVSSRTMEQHIHQIRKKLRLGAERGVSISAVYGAGYLLTVHAPAHAAAGSAPAPLRRPFAASGPVSLAGAAAGAGGDGHPPWGNRIDWMLARPVAAV